MLKNASRYLERVFQDGKGLPKDEEEAFVATNLAEIEHISHLLNSREGQRKYHYNIRELSGGFKTDFSTTETFAQVQQGEIGGFTWNKRHIQFCDTFFVLMEKDDLELWYNTSDHDDDVADYVFLCDTGFEWIRLSKFQIMIENRSRKLTIQAKEEKVAWDIIKCLNALQMNFKRLYPKPLMFPSYPNNSFSPVRDNVLCRPLVCGQEFMEAVADEMEKATDRILIADWQLSPCVYLKRPWSEADQSFVPDEFWRLDRILARKAEAGVRIYVLIYQDPAGLGLGNYEATKYFRRYTRDEDKEHGNIFTLTHPDMDGPVLWAHHEKLVIIDEKVAFVSGIDLARGRWEIHGNYPIFDLLKKTFRGNDYWNQFNTKPADNVVECLVGGGGSDRQVSAHGWQEDRLNRQVDTRSPWHDIGTMIKGDAAHDVGRHFIERWNSCIYHCFKSAVKLKTPGLRRFRIPASTQHMLKQVMVPSIFRQSHPSNRPSAALSYPAAAFPRSDSHPGNWGAQFISNPPPRPPPPNGTPMIPMAGQSMNQFSNPAFDPGIPQASTYPSMYPTIADQNPLNQSARSHQCSVQVIRSSDTWSAGLEETEDSIFQTYKSLILNAKHYVYLENQFFVTSSRDGNSRVKNQIGQCIGERIVRAFRENEEFKIYVVIPCVPGMNGRLEKNTAAGQEVILHLTYESICRGDHSIKEYCDSHGVADWSRYIFFASFRTYDIHPVNGRPWQEIVYPHSKLLIVDDEHTIIGSANINDRSMLGERDSEVAVVIHGTDFARDLRTRIWSVAMGRSVADLNVGPLPHTDHFFHEWVRLATQNFNAFDRVFCVLPNNSVFSMPDARGIEDVSAEYTDWNNRYKSRIAKTDPERAKIELASSVRGTLVQHPLEFLRDENKINTFTDLLKNPSVGLSKEGLAQWLTGHLFE